MSASWGTRKSWSNHFDNTTLTTDASGKTISMHQPVVFSERATASKTSLTSSLKSPLSSKPRGKGLPRGRGVVYGDLEPIPIDPAVDPDWDLCFNCWKTGHSHKECQYPKFYDYCRNCGRRGVNWTTCPRCAKGYRDYQGWRVANNRPEFKDWREKPVVSKQEIVTSTLLTGNQSSEIYVPANAFPLGSKSTSDQPEFSMDKSFPKVENRSEDSKQPAGMAFSTSEKNLYGDQSSLSPPPMHSLTRKTDEKIDYPAKQNIMLYSQAIRKIIVENDRANQSMSTGKQSNSNSLGESMLSSEEGDFIDDDEDLDGIIVDEEENSEPEQPHSGTIQDFINLIELVKHLPIQTQNRLVEQFAKERRVKVFA